MTNYKKYQRIVINDESEEEFYVTERLKSVGVEEKF